MMRKLWPTRIVNKNGVATTVHKRAEVDQVVSRASIPLPVVISQHTRNHESRMQTLVTLLDYGNDSHLRESLEALLNDSTPQQLATVDESLDEFRKYHHRDYNLVADQHYIRQSEVLASIFLLVREDPEVVHEVLAVRAAFSSDWSCSTMKNLFHLNEFVRGVKDDENRDPEGRCQPLDLSTPERLNAVVAMVRFAYEANRRFGKEDFYPLIDREEQKYSSDGMWRGRVQAQVYKSEALRLLIAERPEVVGDMLDLMIEHRTDDAQILRGLIEGTPSKPMASGYL